MSHPDLGPFLHAIAEPARRRILQALKEKGGNSLGKGTGLCACDIEERVKLSQPNEAGAGSVQMCNSASAPSGSATVALAGNAASFLINGKANSRR